ncbi:MULTISPECIES: alpha/beta fold hydrolase [unclassified Kitasatospora]|uniref:alpha/beta fold hydrolase n=1 Tax=unclassified Kitasatospora TaxID=2633591 RepID=UPI0024742029|nr:alpha/beta hydrolase [Kitasatospora sp. MAP12-44]
MARKPSRRSGWAVPLLLRVPALFLLGARSAMHDSREVADRIGRLVPSARVEIVPGAGHALPTDKPELVADRILDAVTR